MPLFTAAAERLDEIPGIGRIAAAIIIAEIGLDMSRFPTAGHLASWAKFAPGVKESAGKKKGRGSAGHGNSYLARILGEADTRSVPSSVSARIVRGERLAASRWRRQDGRKYARLSSAGGVWRGLVQVLDSTLYDCCA